MSGARGRRTTDWARDLGLAAPIVCAPMGGVAGGRLARAVSAAGGLGMIGMGSAASIPALERELGELGDAAARGGAPFGIGLVAWGIAREPALLARALDAGPALVSVSFGEWDGARPRWVDDVRRAGALAVCQVATADEALAAADAGVDAVIARGLEGGGHGDHREPRDALLERVLAAVDVPVLAAGGVSSAADVARVLEAGAAAAWVGTAFLACVEALTSPRAKAELFRADGADTVVSRVMDVALERPWPDRFPERMLRTPFVARWHGREAALAADDAAKAEFRAAAASEDFSVLPLDAGLGVGRLDRERSAAEVVAELAGE